MAERFAPTPLPSQYDRGVLSAMFSKIARAIPWSSTVGIYNVLDYGAKGNGAADDTAAIQRAIAAASDAGWGQVLVPPGTYNHTGLTIATPNITLRGVGWQSKLMNTGTGADLTLSANYLEVSDLALWSNGGANGAGATSTYGIDASAIAYFALRRCSIKYHGSHGIYYHGGTWINTHHDSEIAHNAGSGVHAVTLSGTTTDQNGNNFAFWGCKIHSNGDAGIKWNGAALDISGGNTFENNIGAGILIDTTGATRSALGFHIAGNYFENNREGNIYLRGQASSYIVSGGTITGNYLAAVSGATMVSTSLLRGAGALDGVFIAGNRYSDDNATVTSSIDLGGSAWSTCTVIIPDSYDTTRYVNLGNARLLATDKTRAVMGKTQQNGIAFSGFQKSDNLNAAGGDGQWALPLQTGELVQNAWLYVESNSTTDYTVTFSWQRADLSAGGTITTQFSQTVTKSGGGSGQLLFNIPFVAGSQRILPNYQYFIRTQLSTPTSGTTHYAHNLMIRAD